MKKQKTDLISESDFTKMNFPKKKHHYPLPSEVIPEDENLDPLEETLIGMEYDLESEEDVDNLLPDEDLDYLMNETEIETKEENDKVDHETRRSKEAVKRPEPVNIV
ncbi:MAG: hypothetical protein PHY93_09345 [Bacteriovorax sp.]|nr:hypothetical protein [Bacteriovorax sp.]